MKEVKLIVTCGLPRSGKSTWAMQQGHPVVCLDAIRKALHGQPFYGPAEPVVWAMTDNFVRALFLAGHDTVIVDETSTTRKRRDPWARLDLGAEYQVNVQFKYFDTDKDTCIKRAVESCTDYLVPVIERMAEQFEALGEDEARYE